MVSKLTVGEKYENAGEIFTLKEIDIMRADTDYYIFDRDSDGKRFRVPMPVAYAACNEVSPT